MTGSPSLTVVVPTHNPQPVRFARALAALRTQTLATGRWEAVVVDNASQPAIHADVLPPDRPAELLVVPEPRLGLSNARRRGFSVSRGEIIVLVDDDNVLAPDYLERALEIFERHPRIGAIGGRSHPEFEVEPPAWAHEFSGQLALRDLGPKPLIAEGGPDASVPDFSPIGAGLAVRRAAVEPWLKAAGRDLPDRRGTELTSGGDNDIVLTLLENGWGVGYFPALSLTHLIPADRLDGKYLARLNRGIARSWVQVLARHNRLPWAPVNAATVPARKAKAWFTYRAWSGQPEYIRWQGACGHFEGLAAVAPQSRPVRDTLRKLGVGKAAYHLWHRPLGALRDNFAAGGPLEVHRTEAGRKEMEEMAARLTPMASPGGDTVEVHLLTGRKFWYQSAFCLWTLAKHSGIPIAPVVYDDGTLEAQFVEPLRRLFSSMRVVTQSDTTARLERFLPVDRFPVLRERWMNYPNIRKLTDVHIGLAGWKLVLDSDLLFFRRPDTLIDWLARPLQPLHAVDCETSYGYSRELMNELAGATVADRVNVGLTGLNSSEIDWDQLESWCRIMIERERTSYYLEQALIAMMVAGRSCSIAPAADYITRPTGAEARECRAVMHHYVAESKRDYFQHAWRTALNR